MTVFELFIIYAIGNPLDTTNLIGYIVSSITTHSLVGSIITFSLGDASSRVT